mmetsp:Transcript_11274/g.18438  ORF Transcript_11274/g.18438 Transcript_11274/m.18438 type:complete len:368 (-) Transcript_11274:452-1555(-)
MSRTPLGQSGLALHFLLLSLTHIGQAQSTPAHTLSSSSVKKGPAAAASLCLRFGYCGRGGQRQAPCIVRSSNGGRGQDSATVRLRPIYQFSGALSEVASRISRWQRVDDVIMGGQSESQLQLGEANSETGDVEYASFRGICRVEGGGFCGARTNAFATSLDLSNFTGIYLVARCDGPRRFKFNIRTKEKAGETLYQTSFDPADGTNGEHGFSRVFLPFLAFRQVKRSTPIPGAPPLPTNTIYQMGLVYSRFQGGEDDYNPKFSAGDFALDIQEIGVYREEKQHASWSADNNHEKSSSADVRFKVEGLVPIPKDAKKQVFCACLRLLLHMSFVHRSRGVGCTMISVASACFLCLLDAIDAMRQWCFSG